MRWDENNPANSVFDLTIYPAHEGARLLNPDGTVRNPQSADLARYPVMTLRSRQAELRQARTPRVPGALTITYIERDTSRTRSNAYSGPDYGPPMAHSTTREVVFSVQNAKPLDRLPPAELQPEISGFATFQANHFPGCRTAMLDAIWPIVVEDEHCEMPVPKPSLRDYQGAICSGHPVEVTPLSRPLQEFGNDYPNREQVLPPPADVIKIVLDLKITERGTGSA